MPPLTAICIVSSGDRADAFESCLHDVLDHSPLRDVELRLGFSQATLSLHMALGVLCTNAAKIHRHELHGGVERFRWLGPENMTVWAWQAPASQAKEHLLDLLFHDVRLDAAYAVWLDDQCTIKPGWWEALRPLLDQGIDYIGQPRWHDYRPGEVEAMQSRPWYLGVPPARREGRPGVSFMGGDCCVVRSERLREAQFPGRALRGNDSPALAAGQVVLGAIAHQMDWTQAAYDIQAVPAPLQYSKHPDND
jgi:hypothetical protein